MVNIMVSKTIDQSSSLCLPAKNNLERATCKEQGLPAKQIVHLYVDWGRNPASPLRLFKYYWVHSVIG